MLQSCFRLVHRQGYFDGVLDTLNNPLHIICDLGPAILLDMRERSHTTRYKNHGF